MTAGDLSQVPREARRYQGTSAGLLTRAIAGVIDGSVVVLTLLVAYLGLNAVRFLVHPARYQPTETSVLLSVAVVLGMLLLYLALAWSVTGRTYGDHVMGLRVVGSSGGRVRVLVALVRAVLCIVFPFGLLWCAGDRRRRSVQDMLLRTSVVYDWRSRPETPRAESSAVALETRVTR